ncbi:hypothetical protein IAU60_006174 [Kwoniella sp. DSM 27419]
MPPFRARNLIIPATAFTMAIILTAHVYNSINHAKLETTLRRDAVLDAAQAKRQKRYEEALKKLEGGGERAAP